MFVYLDEQVTVEYPNKKEMQDTAVDAAELAQSFREAHARNVLVSEQVCSCRYPNTCGQEMMYSQSLVVAFGGLKLQLRVASMSVRDDSCVVALINWN